MGLYWQEPEAALLVGLLPHLRDRAFVDVGAEQGAFAEAALRGGFDAAHLIEPEPGNVTALRSRFRRDDRVVVHDCAISDADGELQLHVAVGPGGEPISYGHTVLDRPGTHEIAWNDTVSVPARSLASLIAAGELPSRVGVLKIDTEGHDLVAVNGMGPLECDVVMVEHWSDLPNSLGPCPWSSDEMLDALRPRGFSHSALLLHHGELAFLRWDRPDVPPGEFANLLFVHDDVLDDSWPVIVECATAFAEAAVARLEQQLDQAETDRQARLEVIHRLERTLTESENDRRARLEVIERLDAELKARE